MHMFECVIQNIMKMDEIFSRPILNPLPDRVCKTNQPLISLNGHGWMLNLKPDKAFWMLDGGNGWEETEVPCQIETGKDEYAYIKILDIPDAWEGNRIFLRFDGINCLARVFVDGKFVKSHYGGFVSWDCEITDFVKSGGHHRLTIGVTDKDGEVSIFHKGGIIRDVLLYVMPQVYISRLHAQTVFLNHYTDALLTIETRVEGGCGDVELFLTSPDGIAKSLGVIDAEKECDIKTKFEIKNPMKWDSEHPFLYTLTAVLKQDNKETESVSKKIGFRQIEKSGNQVFINGDVLKLRGINHHDIHPVTGRAITHELAEEDVKLLKEANINFVRTSHYPPRPDFLDFCDQYGIYVEDEIAVAFLGYSCMLTQDDPAYRDCFVGQFKEMIERDKSHPSVIIWSLANESYWGENIGLCQQYARIEDPERLTVFSYPATQKEEDEATDLWSVHYGNWDSKLDDMTECFRRTFFDVSPKPVIHDESTHIPCYGWKALKRDPAIRDFWGETIKRFWDRIWKTRGAVGCAVWAGIDDVMVKDGLPQGLVWGIIDSWRRKKPEYWHIRKGYSPVVIDKEPWAKEMGTAIAVYNRFNHTNLNEIRIDWELGKEQGSMYGSEAAPGEEGFIQIPATYCAGETLKLAFTDPFGFCVEERAFLLGGRQVTLPLLSNRAPVLERQPGKAIIKGKEFYLVFSEETGLITEGYYNNEKVITGGPFLHLTGLDLEPWKLMGMDIQELSDCVQMNLEGRHGRIGVHYTIRIDSEGLMEVTYTITDMPYPSPRKIAITSSVISHQGGYDEVGVSFMISKELDTLNWKRKGLWDVYPDWHIGRLKGETSKYNPDGRNTPDSQPEWDWKQDELDWPVFGKYEFGHRGTRDFSSMKSYIERASLKNNTAAFTVFSDNTESVRMEITADESHLISDRDPSVSYYGDWFMKDNRYHSYGGSETWSSSAGDWCTCTFEGTGVVWYSSLDRICGMADVYIDDVLMERDIDLGCSRIAKDPRGYQKYYRYPVFAVQNLNKDIHTIKIVVKGVPGNKSFNSYVNIDAFLILDGEEIGDTRFIIDNEFNYPEISWADYCKPPIRIETGYSRKVSVQMTDK